MSTISPILTSLVTLLFLPGPGPVPTQDTSRLREILQDSQAPRHQNQAALLLVQSHDVESEAVVRQGLRQPDAPEVFLALAAAVRLCRDGRFAAELTVALHSSRPAVRQAASETLAATADAEVVGCLCRLALDGGANLATRQAALSALGRSGRKDAVEPLLDVLACGPEALGPVAAAALTDLTGQPFAADVPRWLSWWRRHREMPDVAWLEQRLAFQASRAHRLEGALERARSQVTKLHQQLYARMPAADRPGHLQTMAEQDEAAVRVQAATWGAELLPSADAPGQRVLTEVFLKLSRDGVPEVQRTAVLALGRAADARAFERLGELLGDESAGVRAAAARSLAAQARGSSREARVRLREVVPLLQKVLDDPALEVVVEAAEGLGALGVPEAGPVLAGLLRHPSESVRQTAAQALERTAAPPLLELLLEGLEDSNVTVRFSLVGAVAQAAGAGKGASDGQRDRLLSRLEQMLLQDPDPGVRSRAASALGELGSPASLPALWKRVLATEDSRVQEKAWSALAAILGRSGDLEAVHQWDRTLAVAGQNVRRLQLLTELHDRWRKAEGSARQAEGIEPLLVEAQLQQGNWATAWPLVRERLARTNQAAEVKQGLRWLLAVAEQAHREGKVREARQALQQGQPFLTRQGELAVEFERLEKKIQQPE